MPPAFSAQATIAAPEPGDIDGALEQISSGERGAVNDLGLPGSTDLLVNTPVHVLGMSIDPPDSVFKVRPGKDVFNIAGPLRGVKSGSNQASMVQMGGSDLAGKCFGGITWSGMGDPEQGAQGGALASVSLALPARHGAWGQSRHKT